MIQHKIQFHVSRDHSECFVTLSGIQCWLLPVQQKKGGGRMKSALHSCLGRDAAPNSGKNLWTVKPLAIEAAVSSLAFQARFTFPCITQHGSNYDRLAEAISIIRTIVAERCVQLRLNPNLVLLPLITITADYLTGLKRSEFQRLLATPMTAK